MPLPGIDSTGVVSVVSEAARIAVRVCGIQVNISLPAMRRYLYGEDVDANWTPLTAKFDYQWQIVKDGQFLREPLAERDHQEVDGPALVY